MSSRYTPEMPRRARLRLSHCRFDELLSIKHSRHSMHTVVRSRAYVCIFCRHNQSSFRGSRHSSTSAEPQPAIPQPLDPTLDVLNNNRRKRAGNDGTTQIRNVSASPLRRNYGIKTTAAKVTNQDSLAVRDSELDPDNDDLPKIKLSPEQLKVLEVAHRLRERLQKGFLAQTGQRPISPQGLSFEDAVKSLKTGPSSTDEERSIRQITAMYKGQELSVALKDLQNLTQHRSPLHMVANERKTKKPWSGLRTAVEGEAPATMKARRQAQAQARLRKVPTRTTAAMKRGEKQAEQTARRQAQVQARIRKLSEHDPRTVAVERHTENLSQAAREQKSGAQLPESRIQYHFMQSDKPEPKRKIAIMEGPDMKSVEAQTLEMNPLSEETPPVPGLSFDLSRVLFNPGVYQLQDPRSRVYNFSPYLQQPMPVSEFRFDALNEYVASSRDVRLRDLGLKYKKKYLGSTSSMSAALVHLHLLLSAFRPIDVSTLSQQFQDPARGFTAWQKSPAAVFLNWKDGVYAIDADKEYDTANILMSLGKSLEKLFTLPKEEFELYRKSTEKGSAYMPKPEPEVYHYSECGGFLLRSQLDAYDARLPGTGMFDLKTRAVLSIRMNSRQHEEGMGYEIARRFGEKESYEREYFDMIRSAFMKYSLQVRMGRMDGIFVAYHNIERIFGFQYISLPEMDSHLHGSEDVTLGNYEFKLSLHLLNDLLNRATKALPEQSLRLHIEARDVSAEDSHPFMYFFAEAVSDEDIEKIQTFQKAEIDAFEQKIFKSPSDPDHEAGARASGESSTPSMTEDMAHPEVANQLLSGGHSNEAPFDETTSASQAPKPLRFERELGQLVAFKVTVRNRVNGEIVLRPEKLQASDEWTMDYVVQELSQKQAILRYNQCRIRREKLFKSQQEEVDLGRNPFYAVLRELALKGARNRIVQDEADAKRPVLILDRVQ